MEKPASILFIYEKLFQEFTVSSVSQISKSVKRTRKDVNMKNGNTNRNYLAYSFSPHFSLYFVCSTNTAYAGDRDDEKPSLYTTNSISKKPRQSTTMPN